ncbi:hypothetical protein PQX77_012356 [Marasmius sp. AFHP31]|nr:hypothetical protein PQX77_012356 [Marasmius sp. AFHP31]
MSSSTPGYAFSRALETRDFLNDPSLLTRHANPDAPIRSFEGRVGNAYLGNVLVTSPNMDVLYTPPINECRVRLRKALHFGQDDPLFHPQPFNRPIAHLAIVRTPSPDPDHRLSAAWVRPTSEDFEQRAALDVCEGLGRLSRALYWRFHAMASEILDRSASKREDPYVSTQSTQLRSLLERLESQWATESVTFLRFTSAQRQCLELLARLDWIEGYRERFMARGVEGKAVSVDQEIMGAFSDDLDVVDCLFHAGISVWYTRPIAQSLDVRVDKATTFIGVDYMKKIELHGGYKVDLAESQPSSHVIYVGLANKPKQYQAMANFVHSLFQYPSLFGSSEPRSSTSLARASLSSSAAVPGSSRSTPYARTKAPASSKHSVNTFLNPTSPLMPSSVSAWKSALEALSAHDNSVRTPDGVGGGYSLPPPQLFINPQRDETKATLICNWLKLRQVLLYRLSVESRRLSNKEWRALLMDASPGTSPSDPKRVLRFEEMGEVLQDFINGQELEEGKLPAPQIVREIMHELFELNFRQELVILDAQLDESGMSTYNQQCLLDVCWVGSADCLPHVDRSGGLGDDTFQGRLPYLAALHKVMSTWRISKPIELMDTFPVNEAAHNFSASVGRVERALALSYTSAALDLFARAASVPHHLR